MPPQAPSVPTWTAVLRWQSCAEASCFFPSDAVEPEDGKQGKKPSVYLQSFVNYLCGKFLCYV